MMDMMDMIANQTIHFDRNATDPVAFAYRSLRDGLRQSIMDDSILHAPGVKLSVEDVSKAQEIAFKAPLSIGHANTAEITR